MLHKSESGRSMVEIIAVLSIIGVLSVVGIYGYMRLKEKHDDNELASRIALNAMYIKTAMQQLDFKDKASFDEFLAGMKTRYKNYTLSYRASDTFDKTYIMEMADQDGNYIKGKKCRQILKNLSNNPESTNVSFTVDNEDSTSETIWLAGKSIDLTDVCGG